MDILVIALFSAICGAGDWVAIARFGRAKRKWFRGFLTLRHGIPSHDTFGRVFGALDPDAFRTAFLAWVQTVAEELPGKVIAVDGKTLPRTFDTASAKAAINARARELGTAYVSRRMELHDSPDGDAR